MRAGTLVSLPVPQTESDGVRFASQFVFERKHSSGFKRGVGLVGKDKIIVFNRGIFCLETSLDIRIRIESKCNEADLSGEDLVLNK